jgi:hypothetical protein
MFFLESGRLFVEFGSSSWRSKEKYLKYNAVLADPDSAESLGPDSMNLKPKH